MVGLLTASLGALFAGLALASFAALVIVGYWLDTLALDSARNAILIAVFTNTAVKLLLAYAIDGLALGLRVGIIVLSAILLATVSLLI